MVPTFDGNTLENESFSSGGHSEPCGAGPQILRKSCEVKIQAREGDIQQRTRAQNYPTFLIPSILLSYSAKAHNTAFFEGQLGGAGNSVAGGGYRHP